MVHSYRRPGMAGELFDGYEHEDFFDEVFEANGSVRPHYEDLVALSELTPDRACRPGPACGTSAFRTAGITFTVYGEDEGVERTFPMDLLPRVIPADEWADIEAGLHPAGHGPQPVPRRPLRRRAGRRARRHRPAVAGRRSSTASAARRSACPVPNGARCLVAGIDLVRDLDGTYRVLEDNLRNPSGISYVLENRAAMTRVLPARVRQPARCARSTTTATSLLDALRHVAPPSAGERPDRRRAHARRRSTAPTSSTRSWPGRWASSSSRVATSSSRTTSCRCARPRPAARRRHLPPHRRRVPRPRRVPLRLDARRARAHGRGRAPATSRSPTPSATAWPTTRPSTPSCPSSSGTTSARSRSSPTCDTYLLWDDDQRAEVLDRIDELVDEAGGRVAAGTGC